MDIILRITGFEDLPYDDTVGNYLQENSELWKQFIARNPSLRLMPRITTVPAKSIKVLQDETVKLSGIRGIDMLSYYTLSGAREEDVDQLFREING